MESLHKAAVNGQHFALPIDAKEVFDSNLFDVAEHPEVLCFSESSRAVFSANLQWSTIINAVILSKSAVDEFPSHMPFRGLQL